MKIIDTAGKGKEILFLNPYFRIKIKFSKFKKV